MCYSSRFNGANVRIAGFSSGGIAQPWGVFELKLFDFLTLSVRANDTYFSNAHVRRENHPSGAPLWEYCTYVSSMEPTGEHDWK